MPPHAAVAIAFTPQPAKRKHYSKKPRRAPLSQILDFQANLYERALTCPEDRDSAACVRAWDVLEERKRVMRMKPKPKDAEVVFVRKAGRTTSHTLSIIDDAPPATSPTTPPGARG